MDLDGILKDLGQFGRYQAFIFLLLFFSVVYTTFYSISYVFTAGDLQYRCYVPECEEKGATEFKPYWLKNAVPFNFQSQPEKCVRYLYKNETFNQTCRENSFNSKETEKCTEFIFETGETTIAKEFNLLCPENKWKLAAVGTVNNVGQFIGLPIAGIFSDRFGRKNLLITSMLISSAVGVLRSFSTSYMVFLCFEMLDAIVSSGCYSAAFILGIEIVGPEKRVLGSTMLSCCYSIGEVLLGIVAWLINDWRLYLRVLYIPGVFFVCYIWLIPESIRWLITHKKHGQVKKIINQIAITNKKTISTVWQQKLDLLESEDLKADKTSANHNHSTLEKPMKQILSSKIMLCRLLICSFSWITNTFVFYGLSLNSVTVAGNKYLNFILVSLAEIPGYVITLFILDRAGRRLSLFIFLFLSGVACISFYFVPKEMLLLRMCLFLAGKCSITASFTVLYVFSSEMFPTSLRHSLMGTCSMFGRVGSMIAPQTPLLANYIEPTLIFGAFSVTAASLGLLLPETQNCQLPNSILEAENIGKVKHVNEEEKRI